MGAFSSLGKSPIPAETVHLCGQAVLQLEMAPSHSLVGSGVQVQGREYLPVSFVQAAERVLDSEGHLVASRPPLGLLR